MAVTPRYQVLKSGWRGRRGPPAQEPLPARACRGLGAQGEPRDRGVKSARACPPGSLAAAGRQVYR